MPTKIDITDNNAASTASDSKPTTSIKPIQQPINKSVDQLASRSASQPVRRPASQPVSQPAHQPTSRSANKSTSQPASSPTRKTTHKFAHKLTSKSTNKSTHKKTNKITPYLVCVVIFVIVAAGIAAVLYFINRRPADEDFFVSDDTKTTISLPVSSSDSTGDSSHVQTRFVYEYDGDNVVGLKTYFEYTDEEAARVALEARKSLPEFKNAVLEGKYIVVTADADQFKGLTASDVRQQADAINQFNASKEQKENEPNDESLEGEQEAPQE